MRTFIAAGHVPGGGARGHGLEEGQVAADVALMLVAELKRRGRGAELVPNELDLRDTITWIAQRRKPGDRALELHLNAAGNAGARGAMVAVSASSRAWGSTLVAALARAGIPKWSRGVYHETEVAAWRGWKHLGFPHQLPNAALLELAFVTSAADVEELRTPAARREVVLALADALEPGSAPARLYRYSIRAPRTTIEAVKAFLRARKQAEAAR